jgi:hypothetical protein
MPRSSRRFLALLLVAVLTVAGCTGTASSPPSQAPASSSAPSAPASAAPSESSGEGPTTPEEAAALVIEQNQDFLGFREKDPEAIGQCCWWEVSRTPEGYEVLVHAGWGDCPSGCIENHEWTYQVTQAGDVTLVHESGDDVPAGGIPAGIGGY